MGVLACDRQGCENIMCDFYSHTYGYLCSECKTELESFDGGIGDFMFSEKGSASDKSWWVEEVVNKEFKSRYEEE